ncbi:hypothetical protein [Streptosporangium sp. NPDC004631]
MRASVVLAGMLTAVALSLTAVIGIMFIDLDRLRAEESAGQEALATARSVAVDMLSYDYRTIEQDFSRARVYTTGSLTQYYRDLGATLVPTVKRQRTVQEATVAGAAVESATSDRVEVLLFVNMGTVKTLPGERQPRRQVSQNRARLVMVKQDGRWLVAELSTLLGDPPPN